MKLKHKILNSSIKQFSTELKRRLLQFRYRKNASSVTFDWGWQSKGFNRIALVNALVSARGGANCKYLEIGCASNSLFDSVNSLAKTGVDPASGGTHKMTSDEFFASNTERFDVIFIDGLHTYEQVRRDTLNSLSVLKEGGWIAFHDLVPSNWKEHHVPRISEAWTGDCWKLAVELISAKGLAFSIVEIDYGVGLLRKTSNSPSIPDLSPTLATANFDSFVNEVKNFPFISYKDALTYIGNY